MKPLAFIAAPLFVLAYGLLRLVDGLDGERGPGFAWTAGHLAFLAALALFVPIFLELRRMAGKGALATTGVVLAFVGIAAVGAQFVIDVVVGFLSADHAAMGEYFDRVQAIPGVEFAIYNGLPFLFYLAQAALIIQLAAQGKVKAWTPVLVVLDFALPIVDRDFIPLGAICLLISFLPLARQAGRRSAHALAA
ncbi:hypothetical protein [Nonomuraea africana]|uniref:Uncharacterized protein n=1 Tax=Nonomuraea africana TaxID=46171 RepID=A0ABR9KNE9_9ACTN|nr:hypothetical protein [Nonomuraea africana]MBE1563545.1 hypothetical protein [Nonomuraea africana]